MRMESDMQIAVSEEKKVLDACCGSRMFWFDRHMSRETGQLMGHFLPRCSKPADQKHGD